MQTIIYNDNCENARLWLEEKSVDLIFTSPPYADIKLYGEDKSQCSADEYVEWFLPKAKAFKEVLKDSGSFILNIGDKIEKKCKHNYIFELVIALEKELGFRRFDTIFWDKGKSPPSSNRFRSTTEYIFWFINDGFEDKFKFDIDKARVPYQEITKKRYNGMQTKRHSRNPKEEECDKCHEQMKYKRDRLICGKCGNEKSVLLKKVDLNPLGALPSTLLRMGSESKNTGYHLAVFPKKLPLYFIPIATNEGDLVFDPFCGNGTTALACLDLKRNFVGSEIVEEIHKETTNRINKHMLEIKNGRH
jgi:DNA modification methylase